MPRYDIDPGGVAAVLGATENVATEFDQHLSGIGGNLEGAATQSSSGPVSAAVAGFAEGVAGELGAVFTRIGSCLDGAALATTAYLDGDAQMAANADSAAAAAPDPRAFMPGRGGPR